MTETHVVTARGSNPDPDEAFYRAVMLRLQRGMRAEQFETWFRSFSLHGVETDRVVFWVPSTFVRDWLIKNYMDNIRDAVLATNPRLEEISLVVGETDGSRSGHGPRAAGSGPIPNVDAGDTGAGPLRMFPEDRNHGSDNGGTPGAAAQGLSGTGHSGASHSDTGQELLGEAARDLMSSAGESAPSLGGSPIPIAGSGGPRNFEGGEPPMDAGLDSGGSWGVTWRDGRALNSYYTFEHFVVGPSNQLPHAAAMAVGENPGCAYNPLFIHGDTGLGKSHLLQAICHRVRRHRPDSRVLYMSCEDFTNLFIRSIQSGALDDFRDAHRHADVLVIDDVQFLAGKDKTQEEFFHTFNALYDDHKQIVISSDRGPQEIPTIEERLVSRFKWGLVTQIELPCFETRAAIVKRKARQRSVEFTDEVAQLVAERISTNVRELEGAVLKVIGVAAITGREITPGLVDEALKGVAKARARNVTLDDIMALVTSEFATTDREITGRGRSQAIVLPRQIAMFLAREHTEHSLEEIGHFFGGRDHTTVLYAVNKIRKRVGADPVLKELLHNLSSRLLNGPR